MDATPATFQPRTQESDQPMSIDVLRQLILEDRSLSMAELGVLLGGLSRTGAYRYLESTELRFGQLVCLYRHAKSDAVRDAIDSALIAGTGRQVIQLPQAADLDGDGDIDTNDALAGANQTIGRASVALKMLLDNGAEQSDVAKAQARAALAKAIHAASCAMSVLDWLDENQPKRRRAREARRA